MKRFLLVAMTCATVTATKGDGPVWEVAVDVDATLEVYTDEGTVFVANNDARVFTDICVWADVDLDEVRERMKRLHEADVESIRHYKEHAVKLARLLSDTKTRPSPNL